MEEIMFVKKQTVMPRTALIDQLKESGFTIELEKAIEDYIKYGELGTVIIPYDDCDDFNLYEERYKLNDLVKSTMMLKHHSIAAGIIRVNNIAASYTIPMKDAYDILMSKRDRRDYESE
jgi:hypothetical protein